MEHISGQYIKHLREERGLTLRSFAEQIYASKSSVYRWEQAHVPENEDILQRIAAVFGTDVAALREGSAQFTARLRAEQAADGAEDTATFHSGAAAEAQTEVPAYKPAGLSTISWTATEKNLSQTSLSFP